MEYVKVCRICLVVNVKMYDLHTHPLERYFVNLTGINLFNTAELPSYVCYECAALLKKYNHFREKCLRGQTTLYKILNSKGKITEQEVQQIDRNCSRLSSNIVVQHLDKTIYNYQEYDCIESCTIKVEQETDSKFFVEVEAVKEENSDDFQASSDDDVVLSTLHTSKQKKTKKRKRLTDDKTDSKLVEEDVQKPKHVRRKKISTAPRKAIDRKSKWMKKAAKEVPKDDIDLDKCVTIFKLSMEEQLEEIQSRQKSSNYQNAPFKCNLCYRGFVHTQAWTHHLLKHDPSAGDIECPICKIRFKTNRTLKNHAVHYHEKKFVCNTCPYISKNVLQAKLHQRWHDGVTYKCPYCNEVSTKWTSYMSHVRMKHPSEFICDVCGYSFVSKSGLNMHKRLMHKDVDDKEEDGKMDAGPYCKECDMKFVSIEAWKRHMVTSVKHTLVTQFNNGCRVCGESFKSSDELRTHHRKEHARKHPSYYKKRTSITFPAKCEHCSEVFPAARQYWFHYRRMHPDKNYPIQRNYVCDICGKGFPSNAVLVYHKRTHSEERQFKCGTCGKAFHNRANLQTHESQTHSDLRPFPCSLCSKAFKSKGALSRHSRCHTGAKPYTCELCGKSFSQSNSCKLHVRTVHLKQPAPPRAPRRRPPTARDATHDTTRRSTD